MIVKEMNEMAMGVTSYNLGAASHMSGLEQEFAAIVEKMMGPYLSAPVMINIIKQIDKRGYVTSMPKMAETRSKKIGDTNDE